MLEELQSKIEASNTQLSRLSNDIEQMRSIEDALVATDQSISASANELKSFVDAASRTHQSLIDTADAFKDAADALGNIDAVKLSESIKDGTDKIRADIDRNQESSQRNLTTLEQRLSAAVGTSAEATINQVKDANTELGETTRQTIISQSASIETAIQNATESAKADRHAQTAELVSANDAVGKRTDEAIINQVKDATTELGETTRRTVDPVKWVGVPTLMVSVAVLAITVLILITE